MLIDIVRNLREMFADELCEGSRRVIFAQGLAILAKASLSCATMRDFSGFAGVNAIRTFVSSPYLLFTVSI